MPLRVASLLLALAWSATTLVLPAAGQEEAPPVPAAQAPALDADPGPPLEGETREVEPPEDEAPPATEQEDAAADEPGEASAAPLPTTAEGWSQAVADLAQRIEERAADSEEADVLWPHLREALDHEVHRQRGLFRAVSRPDDPVPGAEGESLTAAELYESIDALYDARIQLLALLSPDLRESVKGLGVEGSADLRLEADFLVRLARYQRLALPAGYREAQEELHVAPVAAAWKVALLVLALVAFRAWRKHGGHAIGRLRELLSAAPPRRRNAHRLAELLRYVDAVRAPLEWLVLWTVVLSLVDRPDFATVVGVLRVVVSWVLLGWFAVRLIDAFATRPGRRGEGAKPSKERQRSLSIVAAWLVFLGLGLELATTLVGEGTLHAYVGRAFRLLALPVALLLLAVWRPTVRKRLEVEARFSPRVARRLESRGKRFGLLDTLVGMVILGSVSFRRGSLNLLRRTALGRGIVAEALRQRMTQQGRQTAAADEPRIDRALRRKIIDGHSLVESALHPEIDRIKEMVADGWPLVVVVSERGGGRTTLARCLAAEHEGGSLFVQCPYGTAETAWNALVRELGFPEGEEVSRKAVADQIEARGVTLVVWDDVHRICRPILGGQREFDKLTERQAAWPEGVTSVVTVNGTAWTYMAPLWEGRVSRAATVRLPGWTEEQIGELLAERSESTTGGSRSPACCSSATSTAPRRACTPATSGSSGARRTATRRWRCACSRVP
jgi:hypothetical protein